MCKCCGNLVEKNEMAMGPMNLSLSYCMSLKLSWAPSRLSGMSINGVVIGS
jgi:hypothetical protein